MDTQNKKIVAGVDEAGRGPLAGPVYAAAVILDVCKPIEGLADSKQLTASRREELAIYIKEKALAWSISFAEVHEIDTLNILQASLLAMQRAIAGLNIQPHLALIDGNICPKLSCQTEAVIDGDALIAEISAASILAKVARDAEMVKLDQIYPEYGFVRHKGYATREHLSALEKHGPSDIHRRSFSPVKQLKLAIEN